jgi:hypothetical protein
MMTRSALSAMLAEPDLRPRLLRSRIYEILQPGQQPLPGVAAVPVVTFSAVADLRAALAGHQLAPSTGGILYDAEAWSFTPDAEQRDPVQAAAQAADLARARGLTFIVAPALDLMKVLDPRSPVPRWQRYLDLGLAGSMARAARRSATAENVTTGTAATPGSGCCPGCSIS